MSILVKTSASPEPLTKAITKAIAVVEPFQPVSGVRTMASVVGTSVTSRRFTMYLLSGFGVLALILAAVGIAGVVGYSVVQRTPEIGVRVALGARRVDVLRLILGHSLAWAIGGVVAGIAGAIWLLRLLGTMLYDVTPYDPGVLASVSIVLRRRRARRQLSAGRGRWASTPSRRCGRAEASPLRRGHHTDAGSPSKSAVYHCAYATLARHAETGSRLCWRSFRRSPGVHAGRRCCR